MRRTDGSSVRGGSLAMLEVVVEVCVIMRREVKRGRGWGWGQGGGVTRGIHGEEGRGGGIRTL